MSHYTGNETDKLTYCERGLGYSDNSRWLQPLLGTLIMLLSTFAYEFMRRGDASFETLPTIPIWLTIATALVGFSTTVFFAFLTKTLSAKIFLWTVGILVNAGFWFIVVRFICSLFI